MTTLPKALAPWAKQLAIFPSEIALILGGLAARLAGILGTSGRRPATEGAPDGFSGIARRGTYERLLPTEWLLHESLPEEFMRRVVSGEHSFLEQAFEAQAGTRRSLVLFDAGVDQLGAPRIVQLAALVVLSRRAEQVGATLVWGVLQDRSSTLRDTVTPSNVMDLLRARNTDRPASVDFERWTNITSVGPLSEIWFVGSERLGNEAEKQGASLLAISDLLEPLAAGANERVLVRAHVPSTMRARELTLELPPSRVAVQLLRDPFSAAVAPRPLFRAHVDPSSNVVFTADGRRLHVRGKGGTLVTFQIPNSPRAKPGIPAVFVPPDGQHVVAVGQARAQKRALVVTRDNHSMFVHVLSRRGAASNRMAQLTLPPAYDPPTSALLAPLGVLSSGSACFIDANGTLVELTDGALSVRDIAAAPSSKARRDGLVYLRCEESPPRAIVAQERDPEGLELSQSRLDLSAMDVRERLFFGSPGTDDLVAYTRTDGSWILVHDWRAVAVPTPRGYALVGVIERGSSPVTAALVVLDPTRTRIELHDASGSETIVSAATPIAFAAASDASREIAYITSTGELGVYSGNAKAIVLRVAPETSQ